MSSRLIWLPLALYIILLVPVMVWDLDWQLSHFWFQLQGSEWYFRHHWVTQSILHDAAHDLALTVYIIIFLLYLTSYKSTLLWHKYRSVLAYLSLSLPTATLSVSLIKRLTFVDCPWSITDFGGTIDYVSWWHSIVGVQTGVGHCFPAAHASSAYMFFGLYFVSRQYWPTKSKWVLLGIILTGVIFGLAQQLRGAHFISHDMTSAIVCWYVNLLLWYVWNRKRKKES